METLRLLESHVKRAADLEPRLLELLGKELYFRLGDDAQRDLELGELYFSNNPEPDDYSHAINYFHRAYEREFKQRLRMPLIKCLREKGHVNYGSGGTAKPLLTNGAFNRMLTLGQVLGYLERDALVKGIVNDLGLHVDEIWENGDEIHKARNRAVHEYVCRREDAARVRNMLLGENSILKSLFPAS